MPDCQFGAAFVYSTDMRPTQAILPVAGLGTRFLPWTKVVPKELLPIGNKPIVALLVDECLSVGIKDISFVISKGKESIPQFFKQDKALEDLLEKKGKAGPLAELKKYDEVKLHVVYQHELHGDGHAILQAADWVAGDVTAILFGDDLIAGKENGLQQLCRAYDDCEKGSALLCLENVPKQLVAQYGIADVDPARSKGRLHHVRGLVEKPKPEDSPSTLGVVGKYLIPRSTFAVLPKIAASHGGEIRLIDALIEQLNDIAVYGYEFEGKRLDTGRPEGYKEAVKMLG